jgi:transposase
LIVEYLPKGSPELSAVEQYWRRQGKDDLLVSKYYPRFYYPRFTNLKTAAITDYYRTKRFKLDIAKYLMRESANLC